MKKVLAITSRPDYFQSLFRTASSGFRFSVLLSGDEEIDPVRISQYDCVFVDFLSTNAYMPDLMRAVRECCPKIPLFIFSEENSCGYAELAQRVSASAFFMVPFNPLVLEYRIERFFEANRSCLTEDRMAQEATPESCLLPELIGTSRSINQLRGMIQKFAPFDSPVLISGETGTGKDVAARLLHALSMVKNGPYIPYNISCIPFSLAESTLFGAVKGAFTDSRDIKGLFERADKGSLFLDEVASMDLGLQPKFLRVLEDRQVARVGAEQSHLVNFRLISATNVPLEDAVRKGRFREDLMHRIDVLRLAVPPLRDHPEDIPLLAASRLDGYKRMLSMSALEKLQEYRWPGNVRQLFQCLSRAAVQSSTDVIYPDQIQF